MPLLEYQCNHCGAEFETLVRKPESEIPECPSCGSASLTPQLSSFQAPVAGKSKPTARPSKEHDVYTPHHDD